MFDRNLAFCVSSLRNLSTVLDGNECALKEGVINDIRFAAFSADDPLTLLHIDETEVGSNGLCLFTSDGIDNQMPGSAIDTHFNPRLTSWPTMIYLTSQPVKDVRWNRKEVVGLWSRFDL